MKKNSSQWSMSNPDGNAVCYGDAESACSQCTSPMVAARSMGLPCQGGTPAACGVHIGFVGWEWEQGAQELNDPPTAWSCFVPSSPVHRMHIVGLAFLSCFYSPIKDFELLFYPLRT